MITYNDFAELRNAFQQQGRFNDYNYGTLPDTLLGRTVSILSLRETLEPGNDLTLFLQKYDDDLSINQTRRKNACPIFGSLYTEAICKYGTRAGDKCTGKVVDINYAEFGIVNDFDFPYMNFMLLVQQANFNRLCSYVNDTQKATQTPFASLVVPAYSNGYLCHLQSLQRFHPYAWMSFYIDYKLARRYVCDAYIKYIQDIVHAQFSCAMQSRSKTNYNGKAYVDIYKLNTKWFSDNMWNIHIVCPGVVIGSTPGLLLYGKLLEDIMTSKNED